MPDTTAYGRSFISRSAAVQNSQAIQTFAPYGPNQPFDYRIGTRHIRHGLDFLHIEDTQVRLLLMGTGTADHDPNSGTLAADGPVSRG